MKPDAQSPEISLPEPPVPPAVPGVTDTPQPVAYDADGRPLYAAPPISATAATQVVHYTRAVDPVKPEISPEVQAKHDMSKRDFPWLNLSDGEFIISAVRRHPIGLLPSILISTILLAIIASFLVNYEPILTAAGFVELPAFGPVLLVGVLMMMLVLLGAYIAIWVYVSNRFFLTNESVIQEIQITLFSKHEQTVSLANIEDASYRQRGIIQALLNYGSIRLSTEGDETTYRFYYVANPKAEIATLNNAVEAFKNGRPIDDN